MSPELGPQESVSATVLFLRLQGRGRRRVGAQPRNQHMCVGPHECCGPGAGPALEPPSV